MKTIMHKDVAQEMFKEICSDLGIDNESLNEDDEEKASVKKIVSAIQYGLLKYEDEIFTLKLIKPVEVGVKEKKLIEVLKIQEPTGVQLRGMSEVKKKNDDVGKAMSVLGEVTGLGLPVINKLKSRDMMVAIGVISLFL